jgi:hypothetical protein
MEDHIDRDTLEVLKNFVGQTYSQICQFDQSLTEPNRNVRPIKEEFKNIANEIFKQAAPNNQIPNGHQHNRPIPSQNLPYIDRNIAPVPPPVNDPDQMEFAFDNNKFSILIEKKFDSIIRRLNDIYSSMNDIDTNLNKVLEFVNYESKDSKSG